MTRVDPCKVWSLNYRLSMQVIAGVAGAIQALGLDVKELFLLDAIAEHPHPARLAAALSMPKPTVTAMLKRLEKAGHVGREIDPDDLRRHRLSVSATGKKLVVRGLGILSEAFGERLGCLSAAEQAELQALLVKMTCA
jgi:DNA-binding MarR family transcriptional regulator